MNIPILFESFVNSEEYQTAEKVEEVAINV